MQIEPSQQQEPKHPAGVPVLRRLAALFEVIVAALLGTLITLLGFGIAGIQPAASAVTLFFFMIGDATVSLIVIGLFLRAGGENFRGTLGWKWGRPYRELALGIGIVPVLFFAAIAVGLFFEFFLPRYVTRVNPLLQMIQTEWDLALFLISSVYVGGIKEEIQRAFVLVRFEQYLGGIYLGLALWSIVFALGHSIQGVDSATGAGILGLIFGIIYIRRRNLVAPVVAHALYDIITLVIFWNFMRA
jgi:membrane protease YdiL (CAAX protease family)